MDGGVLTAKGYEGTFWGSGNVYILSGVVATQAYTLNCTFKSIYFKSVIYNNKVNFFFLNVVLLSLKKSGQSSDWARIRANIFHC